MNGLRGLGVTMSRMSVLLMLATSVACVLLFARVHPNAAHAAAARTAKRTAIRNPLPVNQIDDDPTQLRQDFEQLAEVWSQGGGSSGYPFWEKAYRSWLATYMQGSTYKPYAAAYRQMLERGVSAMSARDMSTDGGKVVRGMLVDAMTARINALQLHEQIVDRGLGVQAGATDASVDLERQQAEDALQKSYRLTREAMNRSQGQLELLGGERIAEGSYL